MNRSKSVLGLSWEGGAIGNATWSGARLTDVLASLGVDINDPTIKHVQFEGADHGADGSPYGELLQGSISYLTHHFWYFKRHVLALKTLLFGILNATFVGNLNAYFDKKMPIFCVVNVFYEIEYTTVFDI